MKGSQGRMLAFFRRHYFNLALGFLVAAAWVTRDRPVPFDPLPVHAAAVMLVFFITGFLLPLRQFISGFRNVRLHVFAQGLSYAVFPLVTWGLVAAAGDALPRDMRLGFLVLGILPTTITSCVVFTNLAGGNLAAAVFNAVFGNFAGIVLSPLLFVLFVARSAGIHFDPTQLTRLVALIVIPLMVGLLARTRVTAPPPRLMRALPYISATALLTIIFFAVHDAFAPASAVWGWSAAELALPLGLLVALNAIMMGLAWGLGRAFGFNLADRKAALFVGVQKTIAMGLPMIHFFFATQPDLIGTMSLALVVYHPMQLIISGMLAPRLAKIDD